MSFQLEYFHRKLYVHGWISYSSQHALDEKLSLPNASKEVLLRGYFALDGSRAVEYSMPSSKLALSQLQVPSQLSAQSIRVALSDLHRCYML